MSWLLRGRPVITRDMPQLLVVAVALLGGGYLVGIPLAIYGVFWDGVLLLMLVWLQTLTTVALSAVLIGFRLCREKAGASDRLQAADWSNQVW